MSRAEVAVALDVATAPALLIGSPADPTWGEGAAPDGPEILELEGLDHSLQIEGDPMASLDVLRRVTERIGVPARLLKA